MFEFLSNYRDACGLYCYYIGGVLPKILKRRMVVNEICISDNR